MRVAVKNMSSVFIYSTTPRKARLLLKEKKAVIESNNPFTIRLLFSVSECGSKDSESLNKLNSGLLSEKEMLQTGQVSLYLDLIQYLRKSFCSVLKNFVHLFRDGDEQ